jgi:hypothetical protein
MFKFQSPVTGDLIMLQVHAKDLLSRLGKDADAPGIFRVEDMPGFITVLKNLPDDSPEHGQGELEGEVEDENDEMAREQRTTQDRVSLRKRAWPLVQMMERCLAAGKDIVWGV